MSIFTKPRLTIGILSLLILGCARPWTQQVHKDVTAALQANEDSKTLAEWEISENNNEITFKRWKDADANPEDVCNGLVARNGKDLALFEEEIKSENYKQLLTPCYPELLKKLETYWFNEQQQIAELIHSPFSIKFPNNVQVRDVSRGYKANSADLAAKEILITFDDGPHPVYTDQILKALAEVNAKALFFTLGRSSKKNPETLRRVAAQGHSIGTHSVNHKCLPEKRTCAEKNHRMLSYHEAIAEIRGGHQIAQKILGWVDPFFRFPYGESSPKLSAYLKDHSIGEFRWSVDSEDWKNRTPAEMLKYTMAQVERKGRGSILFHDIQRKTAEALPAFLKQLYIKGYSVVLIQPANPKDRTHSKLLN